jgi:hypothetical protein
MFAILPPSSCISLTALFVAISLCAPPLAESVDQFRLRTAPSSLASLPLFQWTDVTRVGGFKTPDHVDNEYSGEALAFYDGKLYMEVGFSLGSGTPTRHSKVLQMSIPAVVDTSNTALMNTADLEQAPVDIAEGTVTEFGAQLQDYSQFRNWGLLAYGGRLCGTGYFYYDANGDQRVSHFCHSLTLSTTSFEGWESVWDDTKSRHVSGPMAVLPDYAQAAFGNKPVITTAAGLASIIGHLPVGHAAFAFDPAGISGRTPNELEGFELMNFTSVNPIVDGYDAAAKLQPGNAIWNRATSIGGVFIPTGYRTLVYIGVHGGSAVGANKYCYGEGTATEALHATIKNPDPLVYWCYDPRGVGTVGDHAHPPYEYYYWLFDLNHLAEVKAGTRLAYNVDPYAYGSFTLPVAISDSVEMRLGGVGYDTASKAFYVAQFTADPAEFVRRPIIWKMTHP